MRTALTIAGSDSSGGAGIQADIKAMTMNGVYAMSAVTALTAQNTLGVAGILEVSPEFLCEQINSVFDDIFPDAVKIGMVSSSSLIEAISERLKFYRAKNIVVDPVMIATSGARLIDENAIETLANKLLPLALLTTPNIPEAEILSGMKIHDENSMIEAARKINAKFGCAVLVKGGYRVNYANDFLCFCERFNGASAGERNCECFKGEADTSTGKKYCEQLKGEVEMSIGETYCEKFKGKTDTSTYCEWFKGRRIDTQNTHGTGCTLSSAIAANLAKGFTLGEAVRRAKEYISGALGAKLNLGRGCGPMNHAFNLTGKFAEYK